MLLVAVGMQAAYDGSASATTSPGTTAVVTVAPVADTCVSSAAPETDFGLASNLRVDGSPTDIEYLRYDLAGLAAAR